MRFVRPLEWSTERVPEFVEGDQEDESGSPNSEGGG